MEETVIGQSKNSNASYGKIAQAVPSIKKAHQYISLIEELPGLRKMFDKTRKCWGKMKNKFLKIKYEHIFEMDIIETIKGNKIFRDLKGLHHDLYGYLEENGIIQLKNKVTDKFGAYKADVLWNGKTKLKSFFPKHWTRTEVVKNILEAFDNFKAQGIKPVLERNGKWRISGNSKLGLKIEMIIDQKGNLLSAYPKI